MARYRRFDTLRETGARLRDDEIASVRLRRAGLKSALSDLELALAAAAPGREDEWRAGVRDALDALHEVWTRHIIDTEAPGAFLDELVDETPRLANAAQRLRDEHGEILSEMLAAEETIRQRPVDVVDLRSRLTAMLCMLAAHRQRGADLVYEAFDVDIGGGF